MSHPGRTTSLIALSLLLAAPAHAEPADQKLANNTDIHANLAFASVATAKCNYEIDANVVFKYIVKTTGQTQFSADELVTYTMSLLDRTSTHYLFWDDSVAKCKFAGELFGPKGTSGPGLLKGSGEVTK